ncbi:hypothetical protein SE19_07780 [Acidiplasma aeolicum]|jgi:intracellular sulfur oxidation DsrE/DsrF family protein|uniref:Uncharacterized protein n=3 Tax=Ferroplasmaceae TaxID=90142 RepID=A0A0Q0VWP8_9ARCH|nr:hypothetical protein TZ01_07425 [Acidiplasma sp. MBA-1]KPV45919.1 hypothetical protein SE19_07780 [Acidiplasma aeolicum]KQB35294.1 hypothetical protein AOG54_09085 [Acidiplasma aeolicum]KQB36083.1 hypothetical protein AOG55_05245 [Acidiplasma cupricumulans]
MLTMQNIIVNGNDINNINAIIKQIKNLRRAMPDAFIEVVFTRNAVKSLLKDYPELNRIKELLDMNIKINACRNSLKEQNIDEDLIATDIGIGIVDAGVQEIVEKQLMGYAYLQL